MYSVYYVLKAPERAPPGGLHLNSATHVCSPLQHPLVAVLLAASYSSLPRDDGIDAGRNKLAMIASLAHKERVYTHMHTGRRASWPLLLLAPPPRWPSLTLPHAVGRLQGPSALPAG